MSEVSIQETIEPIEDSVRELAEQAKGFERLKTLPIKIPNILKLEQVVASYKKKAKEVKELLKANKKLSQSIKAALPNFQKKVETQLFEATAKKSTDFTDRPLKEIIEEKKLMIYFKEEVCSVVNHLDQLINKQRQIAESDLRSTAKDVKDYLAALNGEELIRSDKELDCSLNYTDMPDKIKENLNKHVIVNLSSTINKCNLLAEEKLLALENEFSVEVNKLTNH